MQVVEFCDFKELAPYADQWDRLASGVPFRTWTWLSRWWRHYGHESGNPCGSRLFVLGVFDHSDRLVGLAPWHLQKRRSQGSVVRWLGAGEVCSDYLSVLCEPAMEDRVAESLADYLVGQREMGDGEDQNWDLLEVQGVDARDGAVGRLVEHLADRKCLVHEGSALNCWRIELPATWDQYLAMLSRHHRRDVRRLERSVFQQGHGVLHVVQSWKELSRATEILVDLHQRRHCGLGQPGCFASKRFQAFHREVMPLMLANGQLQFYWLELDGRPAAALYCLSGDGIIYGYQAGIEPELLDRQPGRLILQAVLQREIEQGCRAMDFLRGDEPYKAHFRATARPCLSLRIVPNRPVAKLRESLWLAGRNVKRWMS